MSAQTTINRSAHGTHYGLLGAAIVAVAAVIAGLALAASLLVSAPKAPTSQPVVPAFNAPAFRAEEHHLLAAPAFNAPAFRAEERSFRADPALIDKQFRGEERPLTAAPTAQRAPFPWKR